MFCLFVVHSWSFGKYGGNIHTWCCHHHKKRNHSVGQGTFAAIALHSTSLLRLRAEWLTVVEADQMHC